MHTIKMLLASLLIFGFTAVQGQMSNGADQEPDDKRNKTLGVRWGFHHYARQDLVFSPMIYRSGNVANFELLFRWQKPKTDNRIELRFDSPGLKSYEPYTFNNWPDYDPTTTHSTFHTMINIHYSKLWGLNTAKAPLKLGFISDNQVNAIDFAWGDAILGGYQASFSIGPIISSYLTIGERSSLEIDAFFTVLNYTTRSPYGATNAQYIADNETHKGIDAFFAYLGSGDLTTLNRFQKFNLGVTYGYALTDRWSLMANYHFEFLHHSIPQSVIACQNNFNIGVNFKF